MTTGDLLDAWRDATRAAELAERLATSALEAAEAAERGASASEELAALADEAATAAERAAAAARAAATKARDAAVGLRAIDVTGSEEALRNARTAEEVARDRYHRAERQAQSRTGTDAVAPK